MPIDSRLTRMRADRTARVWRIFPADLHQFRLSGLPPARVPRRSTQPQGPLTMAIRPGTADRRRALFQEAFEIIGEWLAHPAVVLLEPGPRHLELLQSLMIQHKATGPLVTDAVVAALAIENGAVLASTDQDFSRFRGLRWINPLAAR